MQIYLSDQCMQQATLKLSDSKEQWDCSLSFWGLTDYSSMVHLVHVVHYMNLTWWKYPKYLLHTVSSWDKSYRGSTYCSHLFTLCVISDYLPYSLVISQISSCVSKWKVPKWDRTIQKNSSPLSMNAEITNESLVDIVSTHIDSRIIAMLLI